MFDNETGLTPTLTPLATPRLTAPDAALDLFLITVLIGAVSELIRRHIDRVGSLFDLGV